MTTSGPWWPDRDPRHEAATRALVEAEQELTRSVESVAALRRSLPPGSLVRAYDFLEGPRDLDAGDRADVVGLEQLFGNHPTLLLYSFMFDGTTTTPCPMCTSLIDGFDGAAPDLEQRVGFAVVAPAPLERLRAYARSRGWRNVRLVADPEGTYSRASGGITADGGLSSLMTVLSRRDGAVRHFATSARPPSADGQDDRHLDLLWVLWGALDLTPEGRGDWRPGRPARR